MEEQMENKGKNSLKVVESNWDEIERKIKEHRMKILRWAAIVVGIIVVIIIIIYVFVQNKTYSDYRVTEEITRSNTSATHYISYQDGFIKYSNDGASYLGSREELIWNQSYEMENPMVAVCDSYVGIADRQGETVYVMNSEELQGQVAVNMPIVRVDIASNGTVAVLMEESGTSYLSLFDKGGSQLAEGAIHMENGGIPMDIALSSDGKKLGVAIADVSEGKVKTTIHFYNFSSAGQKEIDNLVASYTYEDTIIPEIVYEGSQTMLAFADNGVYTFTGSDTPKEANHLEVTDEIQSVFFDGSYFGLVFADDTNEAGRLIKVYNHQCGEVVSIDTKLSYDVIQFLDNHEICLYNTHQCGIYTLGGLEKFTYEFADDIHGVFHDHGYRNYYIQKNNVTERARLKLFGKSAEDK